MYTECKFTKADDTDENVCLNNKFKVSSTMIQGENLMIF